MTFSLSRLAVTSVAETAVCFLLGSTVYAALGAVTPDGYVFGALYLMFLYHWESRINTSPWWP